VDWGGVVAWRVRGRGIIAAWKADSPLRAPGGVCSRSGAPRSLTERAPRHAVVAVAGVAKRVCARPGEGAWWAGAAGGGQAALRCRDRHHVPEILRADTAPAEAVLACIVIRAAAVYSSPGILSMSETPGRSSGRGARHASATARSLSAPAAESRMKTGLSRRSASSRSYARRASAARARHSSVGRLM